MENNYCRNCGYALEVGTTRCPECNIKVHITKGYSRKQLIWDKGELLNYILAIFLSLTIISSLASATGIHISYINSVYMYYHMDTFSTVIALLSLLTQTVIAIVAFVIHYKKYQLGVISSKVYKTTIFLFIITILTWFPFFTAWYVGTW